MRPPVPSHHERAPRDRCSEESGGSKTIGDLRTPQEERRTDEIFQLGCGNTIHVIEEPGDRSGKVSDALPKAAAEETEVTMKHADREELPARIPAARERHPT